MEGTYLSGTLLHSTGDAYGARARLGLCKLWSDAPGRLASLRDQAGHRRHRYPSFVGTLQNCCQRAAVGWRRDSRRGIVFSRLQPSCTSFWQRTGSDINQKPMAIRTRAKKHQRKHTDSFRLRCLHCCERRRGSGYVLLAFLRNDFVYRLGWLSDQQILDAVAVGQFTPGPVFTTATFIGYIAAGLPGAILATVGIFLPSFVFVAAVFPVVGMLRRSRWASGFLDGVNVGALGLMAGVTWQLGRAAVIDWFTAVLALVSALLVFRFKINSAWLVLGGGIMGLLSRLSFGT